MKFMYFSMQYRYSDILLKKNNINFIYNRLICCNHTCVCMVSVSSASRYVTSASHYQSRSSMNIGGLILRNSTELVEAFRIVFSCAQNMYPYWHQLLIRELSSYYTNNKTFVNIAVIL